jgi:thiamine-phosphate pyrophosphorylase
MQIQQTHRPILCYVTDRKSLSPQLRHAAEAPANGENSPLPSTLEPLLASISAVADAGVDWIQLREKDLTAQACASLAHSALQRSSTTKTKILINDRLDVAVAEHAAGVHLGERSLPIAAVRRFLRSLSRKNFAGEFLAGVSCHSKESAIAAAAAGADYIFFGPVFDTPSKLAHGPAQGLSRLAAVCRAVVIPVLAIGGVTRENSGACLNSGAAGIAAIRLFQETEDLAALTRALRSSH